METLVEFIFSLIPRSYFVVESEEIIDPREHLPFLTQVFEENSLQKVQLARRKEVLFFWDDNQKDFAVKVDYSIE